MKIDIDKLKLVPPSMKTSQGLELCTYGDVSSEIENWISHHSLITNKNGKYTNIIIKDIALSELFLIPHVFDYMDGFSPNLNKKLHIGHFSNLVLAKAFYEMNVANTLISIYGDAHEGELSIPEAWKLIQKLYNTFKFHPNQEYLASEMKYEGDALIDENEGDYAGTKIFDVDNEKIVGIKSNGTTTYFYQDVCLAEKLKSAHGHNFPPKTLYLTGAEQENHFRLLKKLYPYIQHIPLGLVKVSGKKMGTRFGNVIYIEDFIEEIKAGFDSSELNEEELIKIIYNVFAGFVLRGTPESDKNINMDVMNNPKNSPGLYLSYTMARLHSAGLSLKHNNKYNFIENEYAYIKAKTKLKPNTLFDAMTNICNTINAKYGTHMIRDNVENQKMFSLLLNDLCLGCTQLGLFTINKI